MNLKSKLLKIVLTSMLLFIVIPIAGQRILPSNFGFVFLFSTLCIINILFYIFIGMSLNIKSEWFYPLISLSIFIISSYVIYKQVFLSYFIIYISVCFISSVLSNLLTKTKHT